MHVCILIMLVFVEVVEPALSTHGLYILLFMGISLATLFFVSAVLIEIFMGAYQKVSLAHPPEANSATQAFLVRLMKVSFLHLAAGCVG